MASSSRSNRPAHSLLQPSKRQPQLSKNSTPPSVSFIFAEPEQGAPLDSASRTIASTRSDTFSIHSTDNASICSRRLAPKHSISSLRTFGSPIRESDEAPQSVLPKVELGEDPSPPPRGTHGTEVVKTGAGNATSTTGLFAPSSSPPNLMLRPRNTSWFGNLSRTRSVTGNVPLPSQNVTTPDVTTDVHEDWPTATLRTQISVTATDEREQSPPCLPAPSCSPPEVLDQPIVSPFPTAPRDISNRQDDSVSPLSPLSTSPPPSTPLHLASSCCTGKQPVLPQESSLHDEVRAKDLSATSPPVSTQARFAISIPLFGRSRVSLPGVPEKVGQENNCESHSVAPRVESLNTDFSSVPHGVTDSYPDSAQGPLQDAISHPSESSSTDDTRMNTSQGVNDESQLRSTGRTDLDSQVVLLSPKGSWWTYIGWPAAGAVSSTTPQNIMSVSPSPGSALRQADSLAAAVSPLSITPAVTSEQRDPSCSPKMTTPSKGSPVIHTLHDGHANGAKEGTASQGAITSGDGISKGIEAEAPLSSFESLRGHSKRLSKSADESVQGITPAPSAISWFNPWSWYSHSTARGTTSAPADEDCRCVDEERDNFGPTGIPATPEHDSIGHHPCVGTVGGNHSGVEDDETKALGCGQCVTSLEKALETSKAANGATGHQSSNLQPEVLSPSHEVTNPIEQSITAYRSGWASFFSSRKLVVKKLGYTGSAVSGDVEVVNRDENGMEIMEVDSDEDWKSAGETTESDHDHNRKLDMSGGEGVKDTGNKSKSENAAAARSSTALDNAKAIQKRNVNTSQQSPPTAHSSPTCDDSMQLNLQPDSAASKGQRAPSGLTNLIPVPSISSGSVSSVPATATGDARGVKRTASPSPVPSSSPLKKVHSPPNLVLPTWEDTFHLPPRSIIPPLPEIKPQSHERSSGKLLDRAMGFVSSVLFSKDSAGTGMGSGNKGKLSSGASSEHHGHISSFEKEQREKYQNFGKQLPRSWDVLQPTQDGLGHRIPVSQDSAQVGKKATGRFVTDSQEVNQDRTFSPREENDINNMLRGCRRVVVIGVHGWFPGAVVRTVLGEPTGTSDKFVNMTVQALENFQKDYNVSLEKITRIPLEGEGTIQRRVEKLYNNLTANQEWMNDLHAADAVFVATHSQGSVVSTHLLNSLIRDGHICTSPDGLGPRSSVSKPQRVCCLSLCGIHLGPLRYLSTSTFFQPYIQYFESVAARELFEFQNTESAVSKSYVNALRHVLDNGVKMVYVASLNDQVVPIYSGLFTAVSHPLILRALYIDGAAYHSSDFLSRLLVLLLRILNSGISDSGLLAHLSEATAGSLSGVGHSTAYEEIDTYSLAVKYLFLTNDGHADQPEVNLEPFNASHEQNDYEIPWALRDVIANEHVAHFFAREVAELRDAFRDWHPRTTILRDLKRKLQPIQRLSQTFVSQNSSSKL